MSNAYKKSRDDVGPDGGFFITVNILFKQSYNIFSRLNNLNYQFKNRNYN